jgi:hypothetical protein
MRDVTEADVEMALAVRKQTEAMIGEAMGGFNGLFPYDDNDPGEPGMLSYSLHMLAEHLTRAYEATSEIVALTQAARLQQRERGAD